MKEVFNAVATREGKWWVVEVEGVGVTQGRTAAEAEEMASGLVVAMRKLPEDEFDVTMEFRLPGDAGVEVAQAREAQQAAVAATSNAAALIRHALDSILSLGLSKRDAAQVLGVSPQRVSQLSGRTPGSARSKPPRS